MSSRVKSAMTIAASVIVSSLLFLPHGANADALASPQEAHVAASDSAQEETETVPSFDISELHINATAITSDRDGKTIFAVNTGAQTTQQVFVIDAESKAVLKTFDIWHYNNAILRPFALVFDDERQYLWVYFPESPGFYDGFIHVYDVQTGLPLKDPSNWPLQIIVSGTPTSMAIDHRQEKVYVTAQASKHWPNLEQLVAIPLDPSRSYDNVSIKVSSPEQIVVDTVHARAYVSNSNGAIAVIDTTTDKVIDNIFVPGKPQKIAIDAGAQTLYVADPSLDGVTVIDLASRSVRGQIPVWKPTGGITFDAQTGLLYVGRQSLQITVVDPNSRESKDVTLTDFPWTADLDIVLASGKAYVSTSGGRIYALTPRSTTSV